MHKTGLHRNQPFHCNILKVSLYSLRLIRVFRTEIKIKNVTNVLTK